MDIRVAVIGAGSWGTTVAALAAQNTPTTLWARRPELAEQIDTEHVNGTYLADFTPARTAAGDRRPRGGRVAGGRARDGRAVPRLPGGPRAGGRRTSGPGCRWSA